MFSQYVLEMAVALEKYLPSIPKAASGVSSDIKTGDKNAPLLENTSKTKGRRGRRHVTNTDDGRSENRQITSAPETSKEDKSPMASEKTIDLDRTPFSLNKKNVQDRGTSFRTVRSLLWKNVRSGFSDFLKRDP